MHILIDVLPMFQHLLTNKGSLVFMADSDKTAATGATGIISLLAADHLCDQFGPRSGPQMSGRICICFTLQLYSLKNISKKVNFEKKTTTDDKDTCKIAQLAKKRIVSNFLGYISLMKGFEHLNLLK